MQTTLYAKSEVPDQTMDTWALVICTCMIHPFFHDAIDVVSLFNFIYCISQF